MKIKWNKLNEFYNGFSMYLLTSLTVVFVVLGCQKIVSGPTVAGERFGRIEVRNEIAQESIKSSKYDMALEQLVKQGADIKELKKVVDDERTAQNKALTDETTLYQKLDARWYVKAGRKIDASLKWIASALVIALIFRVLSATAFTGAFGGLLSTISTVILGVLTLGVSWIQAAFDNIFFRWIKPKKDKEA